MDTPSSSSTSQTNYDVFLSFRGFDTRYTIISHLYLALCQKGVRTFQDSEELEPGDWRDKLFGAIEGSRIAIIMFSENYARSKWCLNELVKIMELKELGKLKVLPIFYRVTPREVRLHEKENGEKGCFQSAMEDMEERHGKDSETVKSWRRALWLGGDLIGIPLIPGQAEGNVVQEIVKDVLKILNRVPLEVAMYPVGIDRHLRTIRPLLHIDPHVDDVYMVGLLGQGGAGKTTLSKAICNDIADSFDSWCFLPNIRETASRVFNGLVHLQVMLLRDLLSEERLVVSSVDMGKGLIKQRLCNKRVLVILDDVDERTQLDVLAGNLDWFGKGSRIIITTRNYHVLNSDRVQSIYHVKLLQKKEANNLFRLHAFGEMHEMINIDEELIDRFVEYAGDLPLALEVLGRYLRGRHVTEWEGKLKELANSPDININSVLKISFEGLEAQHKEIFLDIACFFKGWIVRDVEKILDSCGFVTSQGRAILVERCLVTVVYGKIQMHDLIGAMGQSIVRGDEYLKGNGIPSRIWLQEDFLDILSEDLDTQKAVKGILLNFSEEKFIPVKYNAFQGFKNLRVLILRNVAGPKEPICLPRKIRWLEWRGCSASTIEFDLFSKLVGLDLASSKIQQIKGMGFEELKYINLSGCISLVALPDLSKSSKLEELNLHSCKNLTSLDEAIGDLENLVNLDLSDCYELATVPSSLRSKNLRTLNFRKCSVLSKIPASKVELKFLENLDLTGTAIKELPDNLGNLVAIKELSLIGCKELTTIPRSIYKLRHLQKLYLRDCRELSTFPRSDAGEAPYALGFPDLIELHISQCRLKDLEFLNNLNCFERLRSLDLDGNEFTHIPSCISKFKRLKYLSLNLCNRLVKVSELPGSVSMLFMTSCPGLKTFPSLHTFICKSSEHFKVDLSNCHGMDPGYINRYLPLEKVRRFVGPANVVCSGEEFPNWVNFQSTDCGSRYRVSLPREMKKNDVLGLVLFARYNRVSRFGVNVMVDGERMFAESKGEVGVHTWFVYVPYQPVDHFGGIVNWCNFTLEFSGKREGLQSWGMRLLCKQEQNDFLINVCREESE